MFRLSETEIVNIFSLAEAEVPSEETITSWLKRDDQEGYQILKDKEFATFLNGFIVEMRGPKEGDSPLPETKLNNNIILRKLKIALDIKNDKLLEIMEKAKFKISRHELSSFFRRVDHKHYRECQDQVLRYFLKGLQVVVAT